LAFPNPEVKPRPRHKYTALAYLRHYAWLNDSFVVTLDDDMRHMFFQFFIRESERHLCNWEFVVRDDWGDEDWCYVAANAVTMNQGGRNAAVT
jgi:hypothetical protein